MSDTSKIVVAALGVVLVVTLARCASVEDAPLPSTRSRLVTGGEEATAARAASSEDRLSGRSTEEPSAAESEAHTPAHRVGPARSPVLRALETHASEDLRLLAFVERHGGDRALTEARALIAMRRDGAAEPELRAEIARGFGGDYALRSAALAWLRRDATAREQRSFGRGGGRRIERLTPVE